MNPFTDTLDWIDTQASAMRERLMAWSAINTGSFNLPGLARLNQHVFEALQPLGATVEQAPLPPMVVIDDRGETGWRPLGDAIIARKRPDAALRLLLMIHLDTVYGADHPFQMPELIDEHRLRGPGVADAKGGLVVMLAALQALERSGVARDLGWQVVLNPDEELGSPGSVPLLASAARQNHLGLIFEPSLPDGSLVGARRGSGNFTIVIRGRSAHVGRDFAHGRNAIHALGKVITALSYVNDLVPGATLSVGRVVGGGPVNVVPDLSLCRFNIRVDSLEAQHAAEQEIEAVLARVNETPGIRATLHGGISAPPKPISADMSDLLEQIADCGRVLDMDLQWQPSGGVCDGNRLAAAGLVNVDTLGPCGGNLHSDQEYVLLDSLAQRAKLTALLLLRYATGELKPPR